MTRWTPRQTILAICTLAIFLAPADPLSGVILAAVIGAIATTWYFVGRGTGHGGSGPVGIALAIFVLLVLTGAISLFFAPPAAKHPLACTIFIASFLFVGATSFWCGWKRSRPGQGTPVSSSSDGVWE